MGSIADSAKVTYSPGPSIDPTEPDKADVIRLFQLVESVIETATQGLVIGNAVVYATRSALYADLAHPAGRLGIVYNDSNATLNGIYVKSGASGSGSWAITGLALPSSFITDLTGVIAEVTNARQGRGNLLANVAAISRRAPSILASVSGTNALTATDALSTADESNDPATCYLLIPANTNTDVVTLAVNGDTARPVRTFGNQELIAGDLVAGMYYLLISDGGRFRVFSSLGSAPSRNVDPVDGVIPKLAAGDLITDPTNTQVVLLNADGTASKRISWANLLAKINEDFMGPTKYRYKSNRLVGATPVEIIADDAGLKGVRFQNASETDSVALAFAGATPALNSPGSYTIPPLGLFSEDDVLPGQVRAISSGTGTPITCEFLTTSDSDPNSNAAVNAFLARYSGSLSTDRRAAIKNFYQALYSRGLFEPNRKLVLFNFAAGPNGIDALMDWAGGASATAVATPAFTPFTGYSLNGSTQYIDTGRLLSSFGLSDDHTLMVDVDATIQATNATALGDGTTRIQPNRNSTSARFNSVSATGDVVTGFTPGGLFGITRRSVTDYEVFQNDSFASSVTRTAGSLSSTLHLMVGAGSYNAGVQNFLAGTVRMALGCKALSRSEEIAVAQAWATFKSAMGI